jgi:hypothetical protein
MASDIDSLGLLVDRLLLVTRKIHEGECSPDDATVERTVERTFILPLLRGLGWDVDGDLNSICDRPDILGRVRNHGGKAKYGDLGLRLPGTRQGIVIEAKGPGGDTRDGARENLPWLVRSNSYRWLWVTDAGELSVYDSALGSWPDSSLIAKADFLAAISRAYTREERLASKEYCVYVLEHLRKKSLPASLITLSRAEGVKYAVVKVLREAPIAVVDAARCCLGQDRLGTRIIRDAISQLGQEYEPFPRAPHRCKADESAEAARHGILRVLRKAPAAVVSEILYQVGPERAGTAQVRQAMKCVASLYDVQTSRS